MPACLAASLLNPYLWHAFALPPELAPGVHAAGGVSEVFSSPWRPGGRITPAGGAYFVLFGLGLLSFLLNRFRLPGFRLAVWVGFALLGSWRVCLVPYFAVVAGPITALNLQGWMAAREAVRSGKGRFVPGTSAALLMAVGLLVLTVAGWFYEVQREERLVAWGVQPDPSLRRLAETVRAWRRQGRLDDSARLFAPDPGVVDYFAWFCPEEKLYSPRPEFPPAALAEVEEACQALKRGPAGGGERTGRWHEVFRKWDITHLIVDDPGEFSGLVKDPRQWVLLDIEGRGTLFGWRGASRAASRALAPWDANRLAFGPESGEESPLPPAPGRGPGRGPAARSFWSYFRQPAPPTWESDAATTYLLDFRDGVMPQYYRRWARVWSAYAAGPTAPPLAAAPPVPAVPLLVRLYHPPLFLGDIDRDLPALPLLAVRAARRALATNPEDANAYLRLGAAYLALWDRTGEPHLSRGSSLLADLRHIQAATALEQALVVDPSGTAAHGLLAGLYGSHGYLDVALGHRREELRLARRAGPRPGEAGEEFGRRLDRLAQQTRDLERVVAGRQQELAAALERAAGTEPLGRARAALRLGLARHALDDILLPSPPVLLESSGLQLELQLMLRLGRADQLRGPMLDPAWEKDRANLGMLDYPAPPFPGYASTYRLPAYSWLRLYWAAATGDYDLAEGQLRETLELLEGQRQQQAQALGRGLGRALAAEIGLASQPLVFVPRLVAHEGRRIVTRSLERTSSFRADQADVSVLGGLLALERGLPPAAAGFFQGAHTMSQSGPGPWHGFATQPLADAYLQRLRAPARRRKRSM